MNSEEKVNSTILCSLCAGGVSKRLSTLTIKKKKSATSCFSTMIFLLLVACRSSSGPTSRCTGAPATPWTATSWPSSRNSSTRTPTGPSGPWRSTQRSSRRSWRRYSSPGWIALLMDLFKYPSRLCACELHQDEPRTGAYWTTWISGPWSSWPPVAHTVTPWSSTFVAFVDRMCTKSPTTLQPPRWLRSWRWWCPSSGTPWQIPAGGPARASRTWRRLPANFYA